MAKGVKGVKVPCPACGAELELSVLQCRGKYKRRKKDKCIICGKPYKSKRSLLKHYRDEHPQEAANRLSTIMGQCGESPFSLV